MHSNTTKPGKQFNLSSPASPDLIHVYVLSPQSPNNCHSSWVDRVNDDAGWQFGHRRRQQAAPAFDVHC